MRHNRLTPARAATALAQAARRATAALAIILLTATTAGAEWTGTGTSADPYIISTPEDLLLLAHRVNGTNGETANTYEDKFFKLGADITFDPNALTLDEGQSNYEAIGGCDGPNDRYFRGTFDGQNHVVSGIRIYKGGNDIADYYQGLFGQIGNGAKVKSVILADATITGNNYTGAIVGYNSNGTVTDCHAFADVTVHTVQNYVYYHGGIAGTNNGGTVTRCTSAAALTTAGSDSRYFGGIVGYNSGTVIDCIYLGTTLDGTNRIGAIVGINNINGTVETSYYTDTAIQGKDNNGTALGYNDGGTVANSGLAYTVTLGKGITLSDIPTGEGSVKAYGDVALSYNDGSTTTIYSMAGSILALACTPPAGYLFDGYTASAGTMSGSSLTMPNQDVTITALTPDPAHFSKDDDTYTIHTAEGWNVFCDLQEDGETFSGKTIVLAGDIGTPEDPVTRMGSSTTRFQGTFDGAGHTLTVQYGTASERVNQQFVAPFPVVEGAATFRNLTIAGSIYSGYDTSGDKGTGGLIGCLRGGVTVEHCVSTVTVNAASDRAGGFVGLCEHAVTFTDCVSSAIVTCTGSGSGFVGWSRASNYTIAFYGCLFDGKVLKQGTVGSGNGSFVGWKGFIKTVTITNCIAAPAANENMATDISATFCRYSADQDNGKTDITNCYYTQTLGDAQGKARHTVTAGTDVTIDAIALTGDATQYTVSGITAYSGGGLQHGETLYYGSDDQLSLTLTTSAAPLGYQYAYTASAGTLSGTTLTMPDEDVTISATLAPIDWTTVNQGDSADDPYMIYNKDQLLLLAHRVNGTSKETANDYEGKFFKLGADIPFSHAAVEGDDYDENYEAIGGYYNSTNRYFKGMFDGDGHTVSGIRIRKEGSGNANDSQGLFGLIGNGANIHDVHLTDARIKGYDRVGGIVGGISVALNGSGVTVSGCSVTDSYITATSSSYGIICGSNTTGYSDGTLANNYYHGCTVNGTAVTSGKGCGSGNKLIGFSIADITANNGALPAYRLALGANITTPPGTFVDQTEWLDTPPVNPRLAPENGFTLAGNHYFASGYVFTPGSTLASGAAQGYTPRATLGDVLLDLYTPTGDDDPLAGKAIARLTITADCDGKTLASTQAIYSTSQPVTVAYIKADGTTGEASAIALDGTETSLAEGWYFVGKNISYDATLTLDGDVHLILADGCEMKVGESDGRISGSGIRGYSKTLDIYAQSLGDDMGALSIYNSGSNNDGIYVKALTVNGGNITVDANGSYGRAISATTSNITVNGGNVTANSANSAAIHSGAKIYINGGTVNATGGAHGIGGSSLVEINGGTVNATCTGSGYGIRATGSLAINGGNITASSFYAGNGIITLGWTRPADRITVSSISTPNSGTVAVATGKALTDGSGNIYTGTLTAATLAALAGKTLQPCLALADAADNTAAITDHAGQSLAVALSGRTLYKDGSWNTLCLPFAVTTASGTLSGDNVQAMTLNTETSNFADGTLTLNFTDATGQTIPAGTPFIIKWDNTGVNITNPVFMGVTVSNTTNDATVEGVLTFTGTYAPVSIGSEGDNTKLYLGADNKLYYPTKARTIGTHRAYFQLADGITAAESASSGNAKQIRAFNLNFFDDEATGIITTNFTNSTNSSNEWYSLDGVKLAAKPTAKGLYIHGGKKVVIK